MNGISLSLSLLCRPYTFKKFAGGATAFNAFLRHQSLNMSSSGKNIVDRQIDSLKENNPEDVIIHKIESKRVITLNRPKSLNALSLSMIRKIYPKLKKYSENPNVNLVIIKGEGDKAFCAGGDVRAIVESKKTNPKFTEDFFREEYTLNYLIGTLQVPYVALIDGITMGGGVGLSVHGTFRVATERTIFSMPECLIGLFPDVGGSYFLSRMPGNLGVYLALTGYRLKGRELVDVGLATHFVDSALLKDLEKQLLVLKTESVNKATVGALLSEFSLKSVTKSAEFSLKPHLNKIQTLFNAETVEGIFKKLKDDDSDWAKSTIETLSKMSPTSLKITLHELQLGCDRSLKDCLQMEYRLSQRCFENSDFHEGVRAVLIDKSNDAKWNPPSLDKVTPDLVAQYFSRLPEEKELKLGT